MCPVTYFLVRWTTIRPIKINLNAQYDVNDDEHQITDSISHHVAETVQHNCALYPWLCWHLRPGAVVQLSLHASLLRGAGEQCPWYVQCVDYRSPPSLQLRADTLLQICMPCRFLSFYRDLVHHTLTVLDSYRLEFFCRWPIWKKKFHKNISPRPTLRDTTLGLRS